jgi:hypothetical protein
LVRTAVGDRDEGFRRRCRTLRDLPGENGTEVIFDESSAAADGDVTGITSAYFFQLAPRSAVEPDGQLQC